MQTKQILLYETLYLHKMVPSNFFLFILKISLIHFLLSDIGEMDDTGHIVFISRKGDQMINMTEIEYPKQITDIASSHSNIWESTVSFNF